MAFCVFGRTPTIKFGIYGIFKSPTVSRNGGRVRDLCRHREPTYVPWRRGEEMSYVTTKVSKP